MYRMPICLSRSIWTMESMSAVQWLGSMCGWAGQKRRNDRSRATQPLTCTRYSAVGVGDFVAAPAGAGWGGGGGGGGGWGGEGGGVFGMGRCWWFLRCLVRRALMTWGAILGELLPQ